MNTNGMASSRNISMKTWEKTTIRCEAHTLSAQRLPVVRVRITFRMNVWTVVKCKENIVAKKFLRTQKKISLIAIFVVSTLFICINYLSYCLVLRVKCVKCIMKCKIDSHHLAHIVCTVLIAFHTSHTALFITI